MFWVGLLWFASVYPWLMMGPISDRGIIGFDLFCFCSVWFALVWYGMEWNSLRLSPWIMMGLISDIIGIIGLLWYHTILYGRFWVGLLWFASVYSKPWLMMGLISDSGTLCHPRPPQFSVGKPLAQPTTKLSLVQTYFYFLSLYLFKWLHILTAVFQVGWSYSF